MVRALITRPREDAEGVTKELQQRGFAVMVEPLLSIVPVSGGLLDLSGVQAILATSANGVRALAAATPERGLPVLAVGDASARCARDLGFRSVESAGGDADALVALVRRRLDPAAGSLIHAAGTAVAGDISGALIRNGYTVRREVLYEARTAEALSSDLCLALDARSIDIALFFSPRTAASFVTLARRAGARCDAVTAYALSPAVAERLGGLEWHAIRIAARPDQASLLAAVDQDKHGESPLWAKSEAEE
jgi:uroporphyrinogen-III synthase